MQAASARGVQGRRRESLKSLARSVSTGAAIDRHRPTCSRNDGVPVLGATALDACALVRLAGPAGPALVFAIVQLRHRGIRETARGVSFSSKSLIGVVAKPPGSAEPVFAWTYSALRLPSGLRVNGVPSALYGPSLRSSDQRHGRPSLELAPPDLGLVDESLDLATDDGGATAFGAARGGSSSQCGTWTRDG